MSQLSDALKSDRVLLMDGAMGTQLQRAGIRDGECYELWNRDHPDRVRAIHRAYRAAGAEIFLANTFQANPANFNRFGLAPGDLQNCQRTAIALARSEAENGFVLAPIGPIAGDDPAQDYVATAQALASADGLLFETHSSPAILDDLKRVNEALGSRVPLLISFTFVRRDFGNVRTYSGDTPEHVAHLARQAPVAALGVNCGRDIGMDEIVEIVQRYRQTTDLPLFARPNAGTPKRGGDAWEYPRTPADLAVRVADLLEAGVRMIGGCCGTTPEHIAAIRDALRGV